MKEIKFRAWHKEYGIWLEVPNLMGEPSLSPRTYGKPFDIADFLKNEKVEQIQQGVVILQQFTGVQDKDGKDIYEGDLVEWWWDSEEEGRAGLGSGGLIKQDGTFLVGFQHGCFGFSTKPEFRTFLYQKVKVVGNIYENN